MKEIVKTAICKIYKNNGRYLVLINVWYDASLNDMVYIVNSIFNDHLSGMRDNYPANVTWLSFRNKNCFLLETEWDVTVGKFKVHKEPDISNLLTFFGLDYENFNLNN